MAKIKVRIAFYIYNKKLLNIAISVWTWLFNPRTPAVSHVEHGFLLAGKWEYYSSTMRNGAGGTRWISEKDLFKHPERWDVVEIKVDSIKGMLDRAKAEEGLPYDKWGIAGFIEPFGLLNKKLAWYCSEICYYIFVGIWRRRISPRKYWSYINKKYKETLRRVTV